MTELLDPGHVTPTRPRPARGLDNGILTGLRHASRAEPPEVVIVPAETRADLEAYRALRREVFVHEQGLFSGHDLDEVDDDPRTRVLVARTLDGTGGGTGRIVGGVRLHPVLAPDRGWWRGSRLAVARPARSSAGIGAGLVRAACALAEDAGALRFDATVQTRNEVLFTRLGWTSRGPVTLHGHPHVVLDWPIGRIQRLAAATKSALGGLLAGIHGGGPGWVGDDGTPVPTTDLVAACDAILPSMVERDPEWAGWCAVLVNLNDLSAMGARPLGLLDAVGARDASFARRVLRGLTDAARAWDVPVLGGHTQLGVPAALSVTALGRAARPVPGGGGRPGQSLRLTADLGGGWRPRYAGTQWDSSSHRRPDELRRLADVVPALDPTAAKDVSMSGLVGTTGMLAEASGCRAVLDVIDIPTPDGATTGDWLTCFPGFAMVTAEATPSQTPLPPAVTTAVCGELVDGAGVGLRWPDGVVTDAIDSPVTGMGSAEGIRA